MLAMTHDELEQALTDAGSTLGAAELHGCVSGALCVETTVTAADWVAEAAPQPGDVTAADAVRHRLDELIGATRAALAGGDLAFAPLLPPDDRALDARIAALAAWCGGFLYGVGRSAALPRRLGDIEEIVRDFGEIARTAPDDEERGDDAERDLVELVEFVRASVQLAFEELAPRRAAGSRSAAAAGEDDA